VLWRPNILADPDWSHNLGVTKFPFISLEREKGIKIETVDPRYTDKADRGEAEEIYV
jgi:anaerobic selenocysteine-containing dehydrogenase